MLNLPPALAGLRAHKQFIVYRIGRNPSGPTKIGKYPIDWRTGKIHNAHDREIWTTFESASAALRRFGTDHGLGFVLAPEDPFFFIDVDNCWDGNAWSPIALELIKRLPGAAVEVSISQTGLHIIACGVAPKIRKIKSSQGFDLYTEGRFIALTGIHATGDVLTRHDGAIEGIVREFLSNSVKPEVDWTTDAIPEWQGPEDDEVLLKLALSSRPSAATAFGGRAGFGDLWRANAEALSRSFPDDHGNRAYDASAADMALAQHLAFWTGKNCDRIARMMKNSCLVRDKWNRGDYLPRTILNAVKQQREVYRRFYKSEIDEWPEPKAIISKLREVQKLQAELLPSNLRSWILDEADRMQCPPDFIAVAVLVALGALLGTNVAMRPKAYDNWLVVPNIWGGIVGQPSAKKTPAWSKALAPLSRLERKFSSSHTAALKRFESASSIHQAGVSAIKESFKASLKKGAVENVASSSADKLNAVERLERYISEMPVPPVLKRYKTNDVTVEKLGELLRENPSGILVLRDELVGLLATWDRDGHESDRAFFLEGWNGTQSYDTDRIGRGHVHIENLCLSIFGGIQPDKLQAYLSQAANGLGNDGLVQRFQMLVFPDPHKWEWRDRQPDVKARDMAYDVFEKFDNIDPVALGAYPANEHFKYPHFCFDGDAQKIFVDWCGHLHTVLLPQESDPLVEQHLAKYEKLFCALSLIFHLIDSVIPGKAGPVTAGAARRAVAWCGYLELHARRCYGLLADRGLTAAQELVEKLKKGALSEGFTVRDVARHGWRNLTDRKMIEEALEWAEEHGWIRPFEKNDSEAKIGRPTTRYSIHPSMRKN